MKTWIVSSIGCGKYSRMETIQLRAGTGLGLAHPRIFRLFMKGKFNDFVLWTSRQESPKFSLYTFEIVSQVQKKIFL